MVIKIKSVEKCCSVLVDNYCGDICTFYFSVTFLHFSIFALEKVYFACLVKYDVKIFYLFCNIIVKNKVNLHTSSKVCYIGSVHTVSFCTG